MLNHLDCLEECGMNIANELDMSPTFYSHGSFDDGMGSIGQRCSVLDHVYYVGLSDPSFSVLPESMTDHRPTLTGFDLKQQGSGLKVIKRRNYKSVSTSSLCWTINAEALSKVFGLDNVEEIHGIIVDEITAALDVVAPLELVQVKERRTPLYLSSDTLTLMARRDAAAAGRNHEEYRRLRNKCARLVRRDKLSSNLKHLQEQDFDPKAIWHLANTASGRQQVSTLPTELQDESSNGMVRGDDALADFVNKFYVEKIDKIRARIGMGGPSQPLQQQQAHQEQEQQQQAQQERQQHPPQFRLRAPSGREVEAIIMGLNNTKAIGIDGIPVAILKKLAPIIAAPISHMIKRSFDQAVVPSGFKKASVLPLHKKNKPPHLPSSYRPVAILAAMSKIIERVVLRQVSPHLAPLLPPEQFGFRPRRGTAAAITFAHGSWAAARARGLVLAVAGYDLSSAFDTIDIEMVSAKLEKLGVVGKENAWFHNYLSERQQQVQYNGSKSTFRAMRHGVPQGSILGPLLFLVLVADLPARISSANSSSNLEVGCATKRRTQNALNKSHSTKRRQTRIHSLKRHSK